MKKAPPFYCKATRRHLWPLLASMPPLPLCAVPDSFDLQTSPALLWFAERAEIPLSEANKSFTALKKYRVPAVVFDPSSRCWCGIQHPDCQSLFATTTVQRLVEKWRAREGGRRAQEEQQP